MSACRTSSWPIIENTPAPLQVADVHQQLGCTALLAPPAVVPVALLLRVCLRVLQVRRKADPAKDLVKEFVRKWQDNAAVAGDVTHEEMKGALAAQACTTCVGGQVYATCSH